MKIYAFWDSSKSPVDGQAELLRIWERSWRKQGWEPRLLTIANAKRSKNYQPSFSFIDNMLWALHSVGGGWLSSILLFNNAFKPHTPKHHYVVEPWSLLYMDRRAIGVLSNPHTSQQLTLHKFIPGTVVPWVKAWPENPCCFLFGGLDEMLASGVCQ